MDAREQRAMLSARSTLVALLKDIENSVRGLLRGFGLRLPRTLRGRWDAGVRDIIAGHPTLLQLLEPLLVARGALRGQLILLDKRVRDAAKADHVCRRLTSASGVGAIVALTFRAAVEQPDRFRSSKQVGACFGLTPRKYQSGETDRSGAISRAGDASVQVALFEAARHHDAGCSLVEAQGLGHERGQAARCQAGQGRPRPQAGDRPSPDVGR